MPVPIHGKEYRTVAERVILFRTEHPAASITTEIISIEGDRIVMKATAKWYVDTEASPTVCTGHAEEVRGSSMINRTSALECCETSAIGRALAAAGYGGSEYASANEVENAIHQQHVSEQAEKAPGEVTFPRGQYRDETVAWVWERDPAYVDRMSRRNDNHPVILACQTFITANSETHAGKMQAIKQAKADHAAAKAVQS